jgi:hypothetical protein
LPAAPENLAEHQPRYHNDALPDRVVDSFQQPLKLSVDSQLAQLRISNWVTFDKKGAFVALLSTCFILSSLQDVSVIKK